MVLASITERRQRVRRRRDWWRADALPPISGGSVTGMLGMFVGTVRDEGRARVPFISQKSSTSLSARSNAKYY